MSRKEGGRGFASIEDSIDASVQRLKDYIQRRGGRLITVTRNNIDDTRISRTITRKQKWEEKQLYRRFKRLTSDISNEKTWTWLKKGNFKRETKSLLIAAQNNAIRTNHIKARIDKTQHLGYVVLETKPSITYEVHTISFLTFFVCALLLIVHTGNSSPLRNNLLRLQCTYCTVPTTSGRPHGSPHVWACHGPSS